jgi:GTP cyclohydrolase FolE2
MTTNNLKTKWAVVSPEKRQYTKRASVSWNGTYKIEKNVPMNEVPKSPKYPFQYMAVGDSFRIGKTEKQRVAVAASSWSKKNGGKKFSVKKQKSSGIYRCWRWK